MFKKLTIFFAFLFGMSLLTFASENNDIHKEIEKERLIEQLKGFSHRS